jgi:hypothetical protein
MGGHRREGGRDRRAHLAGNEQGEQETNDEGTRRRIAMTSLGRIDELKADVRYHRERRDLYRAKMHGRRPTSPGRLRELERACALSDSRLRRAEQQHEAKIPF